MIFMSEQPIWAFLGWGERHPWSVLALSQITPLVEEQGRSDLCSMNVTIFFNFCDIFGLNLALIEGNFWVFRKKTTTF